MTSHAELVAAMRRVNAAYARLSPERQARVDVRADGVEAEVDRAILAGDRERTRRAVTAWRACFLGRIARAAL